MNKLINEGSVNNVVNGMKNKIINGNFDMWQRGVTQSTQGYASADRWATGWVGGTLTFARYSLGGTSAKNGNMYVAMLTASALTNGYIYQQVENIMQFSGKTITLSYNINLLTGTNTGVAPYVRMGYGSGGSPSTALDVTATTSYTTTSGRCYHTYVLPAITGKTMGTAGNDTLQVIMPFSGTFTLSLWAVQLEFGSIATDF